MTPSIKVDFNSVTKDGLVKASIRRADGELSKGDQVIAYDPYEHLTYPAVVADINDGTGRLLLEVGWNDPVSCRTNTLNAVALGVRLEAGAPAIQITRSRIGPRELFPFGQTPPAN